MEEFVGLVNCPDCGKSISDSTPHCIGCGRPMIVANTKKTEKANKTKTKSKKEYKKGLSWKIFLLSFVIAAFLNILVSALMGVEPRKNIIWTVWWVYLTIRAWRVIQWKALLPYPAYVLSSILLTFAAYRFDLNITAYIVLSVALNIGGLILFYSLYSRKINEIKQTNVIISQSSPDVVTTMPGKTDESELYKPQIKKEIIDDGYIIINTKPAGMNIIVDGSQINGATPVKIKLQKREFSVDYVFKNSLICTKNYDPSSKKLSVFENFTELLLSEHGVQPGLRKCLKCLNEFKDLSDKCPKCGELNLTVPA
jgi:hypothetical protein